MYVDEFTKYLDVEVGRDAIYLLKKLGYDVTLLYLESGRTYLSKGYLKEAKKLVDKNLQRLQPFLNENLPIIGLEPSAILSFRDEYKRLNNNKPLLEKLENSSFLIEEFLAEEIKKGAITSDNFTADAKTCLLYTSPSPRDQRGSRMPSSA